MNKNRNCLRAAIALLLFATAFGAQLVAQGSKSVPRLAAGAAIRQGGDDSDRDQNAKCCLQANTGQPGWTLVSAPVGVLAPIPAVTINPPNPAWTPALSGSAWVGPTVDSGVKDLPGGLYVYEYKFCLCQEKGQHPVLSLSFFADNGATVSLNGKLILPTFTPFNDSFLHPPGPFPVVYAGPLGPNDPAFLPCPQVNTLTINVDNQEGSARTGTPTGLDAIVNISGATVSRNGERCHCKDRDDDRDRDGGDDR